MAITAVNMQTTEPTVYRRHPRRLEHLTFADVIAKAAHSPRLFKDPECWSGLGLEHETYHALPTEPTGHRNFKQPCKESSR